VATTILFAREPHTLTRLNAWILGAGTSARLLRESAAEPVVTTA